MKYFNSFIFKRGENMADRDGTGPRDRSSRPKGKKQGRQAGNC